MKRAMYSIPVVGLALTSVGCKDPDPIINTWTVNEAFSRPNPFSGDGIDIGGGNICTVDVIFGDLSIGADYTGEMTYDITFSNCTNAASDGTFSYVYNTSATVVSTGKQYTILLIDSVNANFTTTMECDLTGTTLDCTSDDLRSWQMAAQ